MEDWQDTLLSSRHVHNRNNRQGKGKGGKASSVFNVKKTFGSYEVKCPAATKLSNACGDAKLEIYTLNDNRDAVLAELVLPGLLQGNVLLAGSRKVMNKTIRNLLNTPADDTIRDDGDQSQEVTDSDSERSQDARTIQDAVTFEKNSFRNPKFWLRWQGYIQEAYNEVESDQGYIIFTGNACDKFSGTISCTKLGWDNVKISGRKVAPHPARDCKFEWQAT